MTSAVIALSRAQAQGWLESAAAWVISAAGFLFACYVVALLASELTGRFFGVRRDERDVR